MAAFPVQLQTTALTNVLLLVTFNNMKYVWRVSFVFGRLKTKIISVYFSVILVRMWKHLRLRTGTRLQDSIILLDYTDTTETKQLQQKEVFIYRPYVNGENIYYHL